MVSKDKTKQLRNKGGIDHDYWAREYGVSVQTIRNQIASGAPIDNPILMVRWHQNRWEKRFEGEKKRTLEEERLAIQVEEMHLDFDVKKKKYILIEDAEIQMNEMHSRAKQVLLAKFQNEMPPMLEGLRAVEIQKKIKEALLEVCEHLSGSPA